MAAMMSRALVFSPLERGEPRGACSVLGSGSRDVIESVGAEDVREPVGAEVVTAGGGVSFVPWGSGSPSAEAGSAKSNSEGRWLRDAFTRAVYDG